MSRLRIVVSKVSGRRIFARLARHPGIWFLGLPVLIAVVALAAFSNSHEPSTQPDSQAASVVKPLVAGLPEDAVACVTGELQNVLAPDQYAELANITATDDSELAEIFSSAVDACLSDETLAELLSVRAGISIAEATCVVDHFDADDAMATCLTADPVVVSLLTEAGVSESSAKCFSDQLLQSSGFRSIGAIDTTLTLEQQVASVRQQAAEIESQLTEIKFACLSKSELSLVKP